MNAFFHEYMRASHAADEEIWKQKLNDFEKVLLQHYKDLKMRLLDPILKV
jgi:hypothetical protein